MVWSASTHSGVFQPTWQDGCGQFFWIQEPWRESVNWQHTLLVATTDKHKKIVRILLQNEVTSSQGSHISRSRGSIQGSTVHWYSSPCFCKHRRKYFSIFKDRSVEFHILGFWNKRNLINVFGFRRLSSNTPNFMSLATGTWATISCQMVFRIFGHHSIPPCRLC